MKKILVFTTALGLGGITSYTINLVNELSVLYDVTLAYTRDEDLKLMEVSSKVKKVIFHMPSKKKTLMALVKHGWLYHAMKIKLRKHTRISPMESIQKVSYANAEITELPEMLLEHYDIAISTAEFYCNDIVALKISADIKIAWIHPDYKALKADIAFDRTILDMFNWIAVVSEENRKTLCSIIPDYCEKVLYVPNLLNKSLIEKKSEVKPDEYQNIKGKHIIVTVCRLDNSSKRVDRVVQICKALKDKGKEFCWFIVGDGPDRENLKVEIEKNGLKKEMILLGSKINPYPYVRYADLFVLTSQYEGRPISVDEALLLECPVIVSNYTSAREQIKPEYGTVIVNSDDTFTEEFCKVLDWEKIKKQREYLKKNDVLAYMWEQFQENMSFMLDENQ